MVKEKKETSPVEEIKLTSLEDMMKATNLNDAQKAYVQVINNYREQNPEKFEVKRAKFTNTLIKLA